MNKLNSALVIVFSLALPLVTFADGEIDPTFGDAGVMLLSMNSALQDSRVADILIQPDGKILVAGNYFSSTSGWNMSIRRLHSDGSVDNSFNSGDSANFDFSLNDESTDLACCISLRPGGEILIAGTASDDEGTQVALCQVNPDGSRDTAFSPSGQYSYRADSLPNIEVFDLDGGVDGSVLRAVGRSSDSSSMIDLIVFHQTGNPVSLTRYFTFPNSTSTTSFGLSKLRQGRQYFTGSTETNGSFDSVLLALDSATGQPAGDFGNQGWQAVQATSGGSPSSSVTYATAHYPGNRVVAAGQAGPSGQTDAFVVRRLADGSPDTSFSTDGRQLITWGNHDDQVVDLEVQGDGHLVLAGSTSVANQFKVPIIARLDSAGSYDTSFAGKGWRNLPDPSSYMILGEPSIAIQRDGNIIVAGLAIGLLGDRDVIYLMRLLSSHVVFADGFETGNTNAWAMVVP